MPAPLQAIYAGTLPATITAIPIAEVTFANGFLSWKVSTPFDFRLAALHLGLVAAFWYMLGRSLEKASLAWKKAAWCFTAARLLSIPASVILMDVSMPFSFLFGLAWASVAGVLGWQGLRRLWLRHRTATA